MMRYKSRNVSSFLFSCVFLLINFVYAQYSYEDYDYEAASRYISEPYEEDYSYKDRNYNGYSSYDDDDDGNSNGK